MEVQPQGRGTSEGHFNKSLPDKRSCVVRWHGSMEEALTRGKDLPCFLYSTVCTPIGAQRLCPWEPSTGTHDSLSEHQPAGGADLRT